MGRAILLIALMSIPAMACADMDYGNPVGAAINSYTKLREVNRQEREFDHRKKMDEANRAMREDTERLRRETAKMQAETDRLREEGANRRKQSEAQAILQSRMEVAVAKWELLKKLHNSGAITQEAFESARKEIQESILAPIK